MSPVSPGRYAGVRRRRRVGGHPAGGNPAPRRCRRPACVAAVAGMAAHHGFELGNGVGLVWQPELGLGPAAGLWVVGLVGWAAIAARGSKRWDRLLAVLSGAGIAGVVVHFTLWPWKRNRVGIPVLTEAEGLSPGLLPAYNAILQAWGLASLLSLAELDPRRWRWALVGCASLPLLRRSARHHFTWATDQAANHPAWWNRGLRPPASGSAPTIH